MAGNNARLWQPQYTNWQSLDPEGEPQETSATTQPAAHFLGNDPRASSSRYISPCPPTNRVESVADSLQENVSIDRIFSRSGPIELPTNMNHRGRPGIQSDVPASGHLAAQYQALLEDVLTHFAGSLDKYHEQFQTSLADSRKELSMIKALLRTVENGDADMDFVKAILNRMIKERGEREETAEDALAAFRVDNRSLNEKLGRIDLSAIFSQSRAG